MCCELGHPCNCRPSVTCHTCKQEIAADDYKHIDAHIEEAEDSDGQTCSDCHISVPKTYKGLCRSCEIDRRIAGGNEL